MSCRVLKRDMEYAMMDALVEEAKQQGIEIIKGYYYKTQKNAMVRDFYAQLGFTKVQENDNTDSVWEYYIPSIYEEKNKFIERGRN